MIGWLILVVWVLGALVAFFPFAHWIYEPNTYLPDPPHAETKAGALALAALGACLWPLVLLFVGIWAGVTKGVDHAGRIVFDKEAPDIRGALKRVPKPPRPRKAVSDFAQGRVWVALSDDENRLVVLGRRLDGALILERFQGSEKGSVITVYRDQLEAAYKPTPETLTLAVP